MEMSQLTSRQLQSRSQLEARDSDSVRSRLTVSAGYQLDMACPDDLDAD